MLIAIFVSILMVAAILILILLKLGDIQDILTKDLYEEAEQIARDVFLSRQRLH